MYLCISCTFVSHILLFLMYLCISSTVVSHVFLYLTFLTNRDRTQVSPTYEVFSRIHLFTIYSCMRNEMI
jgi:hypothetical protein